MRPTSRRNYPRLTSRGKHLRPISRSNHLRLTSRRNHQRATSSCNHLMPISRRNLPMRTSRHNHLRPYLCDVATRCLPRGRQALRELSTDCTKVIASITYRVWVVRHPRRTGWWGCCCCWSGWLTACSGCYLLTSTRTHS